MVFALRGVRASGVAVADERALECGRAGGSRDSRPRQLCEHLDLRWVPQRRPARRRRLLSRGGAPLASVRLRGDLFGADVAAVAVVVQLWLGGTATRRRRGERLVHWRDREWRKFL